MDQFLNNKNPLKRIPNRLIIENQTLLLILDIQEKLLTNIQENKLIIFNIKKLIDTCNLLNVSVAITEQNPLKLGKTSENISNNKDYPRFQKMEFSCYKNQEFFDYIKKYNFKNIIICGIESHICVLQTSIELLEAGINIYIPKDAIGSRNKVDHEIAFLRLISSGAIASTTESIICELCKTAKRKEFKEISKILKTSFPN